MRRTWTIIAVRDVFSSLKWYQALLGLPPSIPEHDYFGQVLVVPRRVVYESCSRKAGICAQLITAESLAG